MRVDIDGACEIARLATTPNWNWNNPDGLHQLCDATGWEIVSKMPSKSADLRTTLHVGRPEASMYGNPRKMNLISTCVTDVADIDTPGLTEWITPIFEELRIALATVLGEHSRYEPGREATAFWDRPNMTVGLSMTWRSIHLRLVRPDGFYGIDYRD
ncbi:DUF6301 family protein [Nocardia sp. NPDC056000]|uniref:DUF6301 family protein n=1 Tax=Nocardia sp. NPDC056000 TaxID=3345674 RepID=UPI0035D82676